MAALAQQAVESAVDAYITRDHPMHVLQARTSLGIAVGVSLWLCPALLAQSVLPSSAVQSNAPFWMVDVVAVNAKTGMVLPNLSKDDFRVLDNGHDVPV